MIHMLNQIPEIIRQKKPLIHSITNYVTANDCANLLLACGASPIMADSSEDAVEITAQCDALNINMGLLNREKLFAMIASGKQANTLHLPVILDPVGVTASTFRRDAAEILMKKIHFTAIKGNASEIWYLAKGSKIFSGVDTAFEIDVQNISPVVQMMKEFAYLKNTIVIMTGQIDLVSDAEKTYLIRNGHSMMKSVTGAGCMLSALTAACLAVSHSALQACATSVCMMGIAGEIAAERMTPQDGNASYRNYLIDAMFHINNDLLKEKANYEIFC